MLKTESDINYYAYLNLNEAIPSLKPVILKARDKIIYSKASGWVADGTRGYILGADGQVLQELPQFHDIFPDDWDLPVDENLIVH